ncbi:MAG: hypothetical protein LRY55_14655 [Leadbetterella sp.]|nr:hypothetical protein [Leadbetterella sp.]
MKNLLKILGGAFTFFLFSPGEGLAQRGDNPLTHPAHYKTRPAGQKAKAGGTGVLAPTTEAASYKQPYSKGKSQKVSLETSVNPKRNYKMSR